MSAIGEPLIARYREGYGEISVAIKHLEDRIKAKEASIASIKIQRRKNGRERDAALSTIAKVEALHRPVEIEPSDTICGECSYQLPNGHYFGKVEEYPCPTIRALGSVSSVGEGSE